MEKIFITGEILKSRRKTVGVTQKQIAELCNISERQYIRYENGEQEPSISIAIKIAIVLHSTVEELFGTWFLSEGCLEVEHYTSSTTPAPVPEVQKLFDKLDENEQAAVIQMMKTLIKGKK
jgi:DNA-binding helix-turn-helix protein